MEIEISEDIKVNIEEIITIADHAAKEIMKIYHTNVEVTSSILSSSFFLVLII